MRQLKVGLPDDVRAKIETAAKKAGRTVSDEARRRIEESIKLDELDKPTRDFLAGVALFVPEIKRETSAVWHTHAGAWTAFRHAILSRLNRLRPPGTTAFGPRPHQVIPGVDEPEGIGNWLEQILWEDPDFTNSERRRGLERGYKVLLEFDEKQKGRRK